MGREEVVFPKGVYHGGRETRPSCPRKGEVTDNAVQANDTTLIETQEQNREEEKRRKKGGKNAIAYVRERVAMTGATKMQTKRGEGIGWTHGCTRSRFVLRQHRRGSEPVTARIDGDK